MGGNISKQKLAGMNMAEANSVSVSPSIKTKVLKKDISVFNRLVRPDQ